jgi:hypothetical protein
VRDIALETKTQQPKTKDTSAGFSVLLTALSTAFVLWSMWIVFSTYSRYQGRTDLDMPDWFVINMDLSAKVLPLLLGSVLCLLVSGALFLSWIGRAGWAMRIGFVVQWLVSATIVGLVIASRMV